MDIETKKREGIPEEEIREIDDWRILMEIYEGDDQDF